MTLYIIFKGIALVFGVAVLAGAVEDIREGNCG